MQPTVSQRCVTLHLTLLIVVAVALSGCGGGGIVSKPRPDWGSEGPPDAVPKTEPLSRYGNPRSYIVFGKRYEVLDSSAGYAERGIASWYGKDFHGKRTSGGDTYNMYAMTAAHKSLPLPTYVRVTNLRNNRSAVLRVNDRGPFHGNRIIDLSYAAAYKLDLVRNGTGLVEVVALNPDGSESRARPQPVTATAPAKEPEIYVQVGAFSSRDNAEQLRARLQANSIDNIRISSAADSQQPVYRVRVGPLETVEAADQTVSKLETVGVNEHRIVID